MLARRLLELDGFRLAAQVHARLLFSGRPFLFPLYRARVVSQGPGSLLCGLCRKAFNPYTGEIERRTFPYDPAAVADWALSFEAPRAVYESGVTGFHLCRELRALGVDCVVGAVPKMLRPAADRRVKTDRRDAESLAKQLAMHEVHEMHVPDEECEYAAALVHYVGRAEAAVEEKRALETKVRALAEAPRWKPTVDALRCMKGVETATTVVLVCEVAEGISRQSDGLL